MPNSIFTRIRRNHAVEHATLHLLGQRHPNLALAGHSDHNGFWIVGKVPVEEVAEVAVQAMSRLRGGQRQLAVHPNCGTNFAVSGMLAGAAAWCALVGAKDDWQERLERLPLAAVLATLALVASRPLGPFLQEHVSTAAELGEMTITAVVPLQRGGLQANRVITRG